MYSVQTKPSIPPYVGRVEIICGHLAIARERVGFHKDKELRWAIR